MIIKNPYNIVAKHYRLINALMLIPMIYLMIRFRSISSFFKDFVSNNYKTTETNPADTYINYLMIGSMVIMVIYNILLYIAFTAKKKNALFYIIGTVTYIVLAILSLLFYNTMNGLGNVDATFANFVRDMSNLAVFPQYGLIVVNVVFASGFNIKTLRFEKKSVLTVDEEDDEIELKIGSDKNTIKKNIVHTIRELKYYVLENKFVFSIIGVVALIAIVIGLFVQFKITNKVYSFNQAITTSNFQIALKESYITNVDYRGNVIAKDTYFLVIKMGLKNTSGDATTIDNSAFRITYDDVSLYPTYDRASHFVDIGKPYQGEEIAAGSEDDYVFAYELTEKQVKGKYQLKLLNSLSEKNGDIKKSYKTINIKPENITKTQDFGEVSVGRTIKLTDTTLGSTTFTLNSVEVKEIYEYERETCDDYNCTKYKANVIPSVGYALLVVDDEIEFDETSAYYRYSEKNFYGDFVSLIVKPAKNGIQESPEYTYTLKNVTPKEVTDKKLYEVSLATLTAEKIDMKITIRNKYFTIKIK